MINLDAKTLAALLPYDQLITALGEAFAKDVDCPARAHHVVPVPGGNSGTLLLMPAWRPGAYMGVKIVSVFPDNSKHAIPAVSGTYVLMSAETGVPVALMDGTELTLRRTAAASALASTCLSRKDASRLLMIGTGNLAPRLVAAHRAARSIKEICVWGRRKEAAQLIADQLSDSALTVTVAADLEEEIRKADIISCATLASEPIVKGEWLVPGQHLDLVGAFTPTMSEADSRALSAANIYVDTREGALSEAGEIIQALKFGAISANDIKGSLRDLVTGTVNGRATAEDITLFKSVGTALEDLAAAELAMRNYFASA
jgi:ornithine cyclodeaminase